MKKYLGSLLAVLEMIIGTALTAAAFGLFIVPQGFAAGGVTGFAKIIAAQISIPLSAMVFIVNMILLLLGLFLVGKSFAVKTVAVSVLFPVMLEFFTSHAPKSLNPGTAVSILLAGLTLGLGAGLVLRSGASSGGFDILAVVLNKKTGISVALIMNLCDAAVILMQCVGQPLTKTIYGIIVITISAAVVRVVMKIGHRENLSGTMKRGRLLRA